MTKQSKVAPAPRQARAKATIDQVILATSAALDEFGEAGVRIQDISATTGVSIGSIYHHFGDRDGLVRATLVHNFSNHARSDIERVRRWAVNIHSSGDLRGQYDIMLAFLNEHNDAQAALNRASIVGSAAARPLLREAIARVQHELTESLTEAMQLLADRGILQTFIQPRAAAIVLQGLLFGRVIAILDTTPLDDEEWNRTMLVALRGLVKFED